MSTVCGSGASTKSTKAGLLEATRAASGSLGARKATYGFLFASPDADLGAALPELAVKILDYVRDHGRVTTRDMVREFGASPNTLKVTFTSLVEKGLLLRHGAGRPPSTDCHDRMRGRQTQCSIVKRLQRAYAVVQTHEPEVGQ